MRDAKEERMFKEEGKDLSDQTVFSIIFGFWFLWLLLLLLLLLSIENPISLRTDILIIY